MAASSTDLWSDGIDNGSWGSLSRVRCKSPRGISILVLISKKNKTNKNKKSIKITSF